MADRTRLIASATRRGRGRRPVNPPIERASIHETGQAARRASPPDLEGPLLRLHIGLEDPADLIADLEVGLAAWRAVSSRQPPG